MTSLGKHIIKGIRIGNVTQVTSTCPWLNSQGFTETFTYDAADQLTAAQSVTNVRPSVSSYQLAVTYGNWGKISGYSLAQTDLQHNTTQSEVQAYTYPATNSIGNSQTLFAPEQRTITDANNNVSIETLTFGINGSLRKREVQGVVPHTEHYLFNSAANLKAYSNNLTDFAYYGYNASNTRAYKLGLSGSSQWVNGQQQSLHLGPQQAMFYPNAYINFNHNGEYTKHYYNGAERIASRLGNSRRTIVTGANSRLQARAAQMDELFKGQIIEMLPYEEPASAIPDPNNGGGMSDPLYPTVEYYPIPTFTELQITGNTTDIFYYHTNHLGSTAFVTNQSRNVTQGFLYAPFGEITTEYNSTFGSDIIPKYSFNAKELDEETGMYYYEARYYKPPVFTSRDAMFEKYFWMTPYAYCANNPVKYVDPDGRTVVVTGDADAISATVKQLNANLSKKFRVTINEDGSLSYSGKAKTKADMFVQAAIDNEKITVNIEARNDNSFVWPDGSKKGTENGGGYGGNIYNEVTGTVNTFQKVCPELLADFDRSVGDEIIGTTMLHELAESFYGGCLALDRQSSSPMYGKPGSTYDEAHNKANDIAVGDRKQILVGFKEKYVWKYTSDLSGNMYNLSNYNIKVPIITTETEMIVRYVRGR